MEKQGYKAVRLCMMKFLSTQFSVDFGTKFESVCVT